MKTTITKPIARKILSLIDEHGLVCGLGNPVPGQMCIMAVFNYALGRPHDDKGLEDCVDDDVRHFDIALNDSSWSSPQVRGKGMRREAIAKIGSSVLKKGAFRELLALRATQRLLPNALRDYAQYCKPEYVEKLNEIATECEAVQNKKDVNASLDSLDSLASLDSLDSLARFARFASLDSFDSLARLDAFLSSVAELAVQVLIELKSPGCEWLYLCDVSESATASSKPKGETP